MNTTAPLTEEQIVQLLALFRRENYSSAEATVRVRELYDEGRLEFNQMSHIVDRLWD
jgi:hypothetical protein